MNPKTSWCRIGGPRVRLYWAALGILLAIAVAPVAIQADPGPAFYFEGGTYWMGTAHYQGYTSVRAGDAKTLGLQVGAVWQDGHWFECGFLTGDRDFVGSANDYFLSEATAVAGLASELFDLGFGLGRQSMKLSSGSILAWGPLGVLRLHYPISEQGLQAFATASVRPVGLGKSSPYLEYAELILSLRYEGEWGRIDVGYRGRSYYNLPSRLRCAGPFLSISLGLH
jgi:hypothetical protein